MSSYLPGAARTSSTSPRPGLNPLGTTGLWCHPLGFGCYRVDVDNPTHEAALRQYLTAGGNLIDTSANYTDGGAERTIGRVLKDFNRDEVIVVTKGGYIQGENMALAQKQTFPEVVKYGPGLWHCIHPEFLKTQVERSRQRMELETIDVFLLHNPEYFLNYQAKHGGASEADRTEFYRRVREAFAFLETEVEAGRLRHYGISSNNYPLPLEDPTHTSIARCLEQANAVSATHHFRVVQFPLNLFEPGVAIHPSNQGLTPLEFCRQHGIGTLANRPLNAFANNQLIRLADFVPPGQHAPGPEHLDTILKPLADHELELHMACRVPLMHEDGIAEHIKELALQVSSEGVWEQVVGRYVIYPIREWLMETSQKMQKQSAVFDKWQNRFVDLINPALQEVVRYIACQSQPQSDAVREQLYEHGYPKGNLTLSQMSLSVLTSLPGLSCTLLGMRRLEYVADALPVAQLPKVDGLAILQSLYE